MTVQTALERLKVRLEKGALDAWDLGQGLQSVYDEGWSDGRRSGLEQVVEHVEKMRAGK